MSLIDLTADSELECRDCEVWLGVTGSVAVKNERPSSASDIEDAEERLTFTHGWTEDLEPLTSSDDVENKVAYNTFPGFQPSSESLGTRNFFVRLHT